MGNTKNIKNYLIIFIMFLILVILVIIWLLKNVFLSSETLNNDKPPDSNNRFMLDNPRVIGDIICENNIGDNIVYVREDGKYEPYIVIKTDNYGKNSVLLMRKDVYPKEMMYRDCIMFGTGGSYYPGSIIDEFAENILFNQFSDGLKTVIKKVPIKIHSKDYILGIRDSNSPFETIYRHVFSLSLSECSNSTLYKYVDKEGNFIPEVLEYPVKKYVWLRSSAYGGDDTCASQIYNGAVRSNRVSINDEQYVRPVFVISNDIAIEKTTGINSENEVYILSVDIIE